MSNSPQAITHPGNMVVGEEIRLILRMESNARLTIMADNEKGERGEEEALVFMDRLADQLSRAGVVHTVSHRNTCDGDLIDRIVIGLAVEVN